MAAGCTGAPAPTPQIVFVPQPTPQVIYVTPAPTPVETVAETPVATPPPVAETPPPVAETPTPLPTPQATPRATPTARPTQQATRGELLLLSGVRDDVLSTCIPRHHDVARGAIAAIECFPESRLVDSLAFYLFPDRGTMQDVYLARLGAEGVHMDTGDCGAGVPGEGADTPFADDLLDGDRSGCFINRKGYANVRFIASGSPVYGAVLGETADVAKLMDWAYGGEPTRGDTPRPVNLWSRP
jgi:hypothetical protein